jgi:DNA polymerase I
MRLEHRLLPAITRMSVVGIPVDYVAWERASEECTAQLERLDKQLQELLPSKPDPDSGWHLDSPQGVKELLKALGIENLPDTSAKTLTQHAGNPIVAAVLDYRKAKKANNHSERQRLREFINREAPKRPRPRIRWNLRSPSQVKNVAALLGFEIPSTGELELIKRKGDHEFFCLMLEYRRLAKLVDNYGIGWFKDSYHEGRVYPRWFQIGAVTGRMACAGPNFQNLPATGPYRACVKAPEGRAFVTADYSQIELRIAAKLAGDEGMLAAFERGDDIHTETAKILTGKSDQDVKKQDRTRAKCINFGLLYGMGKNSLPDYALKNYGVIMSLEEASKFYERYFDVRAGLKAWQTRLKRKFYQEHTGKMDRFTMAGRRRKDVTLLTDALNHPVQGTGADGLKLALCLLNERRADFPTAVPIIAAHDEIVYECDEEEAHEVGEWVAARMVEAMDAVVNASGPRVPIEVETKVKDCWDKE